MPCRVTAGGAYPGAATSSSRYPSGTTTSGATRKIAVISFTPFASCYSDIASYGRETSYCQVARYGSWCIRGPGHERPRPQRHRRGDPTRPRRGVGRDGGGLGRDARDRPGAGLPDGATGAAHRARGARSARAQPPCRQPGPCGGRVVGHRRARPRAATRRAARTGRDRLSRGRRPLAVVRPGHRRAQGPRGRPDHRGARGEGGRSGHGRQGRSRGHRARVAARLACGVPRLRPAVRPRRRPGAAARAARARTLARPARPDPGHDDPSALRPAWASCPTTT